MTNDEVFTRIQQQNEVIISLLARLAWTPEKITEIVIRNKRDPGAYVVAYNALDGFKSGTQIAGLAKVTQQTVSAVLQSWFDEGIILNVGIDSQPKYRRLMRIADVQKKRRNAHSTDPRREMRRQTKAFDV
jgi:hypothetical protein